MRVTFQRATSTVPSAALFSDSARCTFWSNTVGRWCYSDVQSV